MNQFGDYEKFDALGLAKLVKDREVSAHELLAEAKARLAKFNPMINAVISPMDSLAESLIEKLDTSSPFAGVPFLVKDLMLPFAGFPMSNGSIAMKDYLPPEDGEMAKRLNASGLITFGKTSTSELGASALTNTAAFGETKNPWDLTRNSGGSSGGSSAAVAARIVPMAYSSDGGGSIRLPASYCGIFGFKPSRGLNKFEDLTRAWAGAVVTHVSTLSVRDSAAYLDLVNGHTDHGYSIANPAQHTYLNAVTRPPKRLRIALITRAPTGTGVQAECINAARLAAKHCEALGHQVEESDWNFDGVELMRAFITIVFRYTSRDVGNVAKLLNIEQQNLAIELNTRFMAMVGSGIRDEQVQQALTVWKQVSDRLSDFYQRYDVILTPTVATPPLRSDAFDPNALEKLLMHGLIATGFAKKMFSNAFIDVIIHKALYQTPFTPIANATGQPAMSVPLYWGNDGLPHGAQFMATEGNDRLLFQLAAQLELEHPWKHKVPPLCR
ncbi:amidase [Methylobacter sp.]|uniref:amidase n=1 Tax=Methylobacter sp. TaxID=2051955 RepID=UPI0025E8A673|nr:amidase [Methylobacter sp.]